ncbi:type II secretion system F family protein [Kineosporia sp. J2-2]|uniref:Type II secretion system F family protein n=1 Tax=Kineosporia corallincola TaxID=2835133 RepID=A0ABS5TIV9_9ACTN|nr:type II secretion system F family protein [Kineosporia corallincola]MBT0771033.1 type II secretion system F family protein [Kineosporia corallincola]
MLLLTGTAALFAGLAGGFAALLLAGRQRLDARARRALLAGFRAGGAPLRQRELAVPFAERVLAPLVRRFAVAGRRMAGRERIERLRSRLDLAGNPKGWDVDRVLGLKALGLVAGALAGLAVPPFCGAGARGTVLTLSGLSVLGWCGPSLWVHQMGHDRTERIRRELPDAIDLLTISVEAGLAFDAALAQVARSSEGPFAKELFRVLQEMQLGTGRLPALRALADRTAVEELRIFVAAMVQADTFGIPVAGVLRVQSKEMRVRRSQRAEEKAQQVPVKILFPLIFCILPALFIVVMGPAGLRIFEQFRGM